MGRCEGGELERVATIRGRMPDGDAVKTAHERRETLKRVYAQTQACTRCPDLAATRKTVVFGSGNADADLMFIGEAPGASEDEQGVPFVGQAGKLLEKLLGEIGLQRNDVFIANTLKCRPPGNRDPQPLEIENCREYLYEQVRLIEPKVICTLGNFSTKLLRAENTGITRLHGQPELLSVGQRIVRLYPIFHPAAALYTPRMLQTLREDFMRLPDLLAMPAPEQPEWLSPPELAKDSDETPLDGADGDMSAQAGGSVSADSSAVSEPDQLGLF
jgi:uracil-DNA glycosylase